MSFELPILKRNLSMQIAEHIESLILSEELKVGDRLPGEIELAEQYGASRNVLREAMTTLKERGLVEVKNGSGAYIATPSSESLGNVVNRLLVFGKSSAYEIYEVRMALEVRACGLAAERAGDENIAALHELIGHMEHDYEKNELWAQYDRDFHEMIASMTGVSLFPIFLQPLVDIVQSIADEQPMSPALRKRGLEAHKKIVAAIESKDRPAAEKAMASHLQVFLSDLLEKIEESGEAK